MIRPSRRAPLAQTAGVGVLALALGACPEQAVRHLSGARIQANESSAIATLRAIVSAEIVYSTYNGGAYGKLECLSAPKPCNPQDPGQPHLDASTAQAERNGYRLEFHAGPPAASSAGRPDGTSLETFAVVATPVTPGSTGDRRFCVDSRAEVCTLDAAATVARGQCPAACVALK